jgi:hypothetical protein
LREETGHVRRGADEAGGRHDRVGRVVAGNDQAPADGNSMSVATCEPDAFGERHVGRGLAQTGRPSTISRSIQTR